MAKALFLVGCFMTGCIASSLISWFGSLHPGCLRVAIALYALLVVAWVLCWLADDAIAPFFKMRDINYYACLIGFAVACVLGSIALWLSP